MKRKRYDDKYRASAVVMLEAAGYTGDPDTSSNGAVTIVSNHLGVPRTTLRRWFRQSNNPPPAELVQEKRFDLIQAIRDEIRLVLGEMGNARGDADYRALATALGIYVDKLQLLEGKPTENTDTRIVIEYATVDTPDTAPGSGAHHRNGQALQRGGLRPEIWQIDAGREPAGDA